MGATAVSPRCAHFAGVFAGAGVAFASSGCLDRPLATTEPATSNVVVKQLAREAPNKIDLLFMIDNSQSMADKQALLADAVPALLSRLVAPRCMDETTGAPLGTHHPCSAGVPELEPIADIHVGVLNSSLGGHGSSICTPGWSEWNPTQDGGGRLLAPHLVWAPASDADDPAAFVQGLAEQVKAAGDDGCGYEASLESWYRFLVDPEPPLVVSSAGGLTVTEGVDELLLAQRKDFLRPDSLLLVILLSDENDCSIADAGLGWYATQQEQNLYRATAACEVEPGSSCCRSCGTKESAPPEGCAPLAEDPACKNPLHDTASDSRNLRCFDQKRRFGIDFLYPVERYVEGLTRPRIRNRWGEEVENPLFTPAPGGRARQPSQVLLAGIVGVPWQDVTDDASLVEPDRVRYLRPRELSDQGRWSWLLPSPGVPAADPLMRESVAPRSGAHPATGLPLLPPETSGSHPVNGHEWNTGGEDLQYACIYPLAKPRDCNTVSGDCDCRDVTPADPSKNPLCRDPATGVYGPTQYFAKAYPGTRQLQVLKGVGESAIVASICPKVSSGDVSAPSFGYSPAVESIVDGLRERLVQCLPRPLSIADDGTAQCSVIEALPASACSCDLAKNRRPVSATLAAAARRELRESYECGPGSEDQLPCDAFCLCEIGAATDMASCQNDPKPQGTGWCYVDPARGIGNPALVAGCPETKRQLVRFAGAETPAPGSNVLVACLGAALGK